MRGNNNSDVKLQNVSSYELSSLSSNLSTNEPTNINSNIISKLSPSSSTKIVEFLSDKFKKNLKGILDEKENDSISSSKKILLDCSSSQCTTYECSCSQDSSSILYHQNLICCSRSSCLLSTCCTSKIEILNYGNAKFKLDNDNRSENSSTINNANHVLTEDQSTYNNSENSCTSLDDTLQNDCFNSFSELPLKENSKNFQKFNNLTAILMHTNEINCSTGEQLFNINNLKFDTTSETLNKFLCDGKKCSNSREKSKEDTDDNFQSVKSNVSQNYENFKNSDDISISHKSINNLDSKRINNLIDFSSVTFTNEDEENSFNKKDNLSSDPNKNFKKIAYENLNISSRSLNSFENKNYLNDEKSKEVLLPNNFLNTKNNSEFLGFKKKLNSDRLISINFEDKDDSKSEEEKSRQLHMNTLSDISMLTFPEIEENVDTYKLHASSRCLLNCSPNQCSSKKHNDLDESNNFCDLTLMKDYSELGSSTAQVRFLDENDYGNLKFTDATLNSGDHSSELDSDLDNEFDQDDDEFDLLENTDISIKKNYHVLNQHNDNQFEYNDANGLNNLPYTDNKNIFNEPQINKDQQLDNKSLKNINGCFKEEASIVLKNKQIKNDLDDSCPAKKANYNNSFNEYTSNNKENLNGFNSNDSEKMNGNSKDINGDNSKLNSNGLSSVKVNTAKAQKKFSQDSSEDGNCPICNKNVYQVEKIKAEKRVFHKQCFRCLDCRKQLSMDSYYSHKGQLYCQVHFKLLLRPKPVENIGDDYLSRRQKTIIIRESIPKELPPDVVRSESKIDDGLDSIQLDLTNLRQRFENGNRSFDEIDRPNSSTERNLLLRSESILAKVQRYQSLASGEKMANSDGESVNSEHYSDTENDLAKENLNRKEKVNFNGLSAIKSQFENGNMSNGNTPEDGQSVTNGSNGRDEETKQELFKLRQRICLGRSASMKQVYENQVVSNKSTSPTSNDRQTRINTSSMKEKFEKGNFTTENELEFKERLRREVDEELNLVTEADTAAKEAKNKFKEMEKLNNSQQNNQLKHSSTEQLNNNTRSTPTHKVTTYLKQETPVEVIKGSEPGQKEEVHINVNQLQERYRFFEQQVNNNTNEEKIKTIDTPRRPIQLPKATEDCFVETPNDQIKRDPNIIRSSDVIDDLPKSDIAKKMLNVFQQLEKSNSNSNVTAVLNGAHEKPPLRCITPPKEFTIDNEDETDSTINCQQDKDIVRSSYKEDKSIPVEPEIARNLKAKFENWASEVENENKKNNNNVVETVNEEIPQSDITKNMRSKFESYCEEINKPLEKNTKLKINRFVNNFGCSQADLCTVCKKRIYLMDKMEFNSWKVHRKCFKCCHCSSSLRLENYTSSFGKLYCLVHFRQLFMVRGNYDEGFGREQHKEKWSLSKKMNISQNSSGNSSRNDSPDPDSLEIDCN